ncbi:hypothetical protein EON81_24845, partial [bacterium]
MPVTKPQTLIASLSLGTALIWGCAPQGTSVGVLSSSAAKPSAAGVLTGQEAFADWTTEIPGTRRHITAGDLPKPYGTESVDNGPRLVKRPEG